MQWSEKSYFLLGGCIPVLLYSDIRENGGNVKLRTEIISIDAFSH